MSNPYCPLTVDGDFGSQSTKALQWVIGATQDGSYGPATSGLHESHLGLAANQDLYPNNGNYNPDVLTLQTHLNNLNIFVAEDGYWGSNTSKGVQIGLNNGTY